ncbi:esterase FrsA [Streptomyces sp. NBC_01808]|uniref:alpha/beta fold hydrolase n=1 Tax=Streptomyces sp. NBC_01808 TaxID=2975947 RepID=UPI002DDB7664|nr:alpha/beta fold hydrolase [Streptomyces sp. NBC_01808]WSA36169.1 esterase FrsA [Streptomyces sp. NBC_01808]
MNDVTELKEFALVHAKALQLPPGQYEKVLDRITNDEDGAPGSWTAEWSAAAAELDGAGQLLPAFLCYTMARFPVVDGPARQEAYEKCRSAFDRWSAGQQGIERVTAPLADGEVVAWAGGLSAAEPKPVLLVTGGIVSLKEQWAPVTLQAAALGMAIVVTELPGIGENTLPYDRESWRMLPAVLDAIADRADVADTYALANSFGGHLALRWAGHDARLRGIVTSGAPVSEFFGDADWLRGVPGITRHTLARLTGTAEGDDGALHKALADWALTPEELAALEIPVCYSASLRDEIIPAGDPAFVRQHVKQVSMNEFDDVHGAPAHVQQTVDWTFGSLLAMRQGHALR